MVYQSKVFAVSSYIPELSTLTKVSVLINHRARGVLLLNRQGRRDPILSLDTCIYNKNNHLKHFFGFILSSWILFL